MWASSSGRGLHGQILDQLGQAIVNRELTAGELIFTNHLVETYGASRSVIRETLRVLESLGMVRAKPKVGTRVLDSSSWNLMHPLVVSWRGRSPAYRDQLREMLQVRAGVEPIAARHAASAIPADVVQEMYACVARMADAHEQNKPREFVDADTRFHELLLTNCNNQMLGQFVGTVVAVLRTRQTEVDTMFTQNSAKSVADHRRLVDALAERDGTTAELLARVIVVETIDELS